MKNKIYRSVYVPERLPENDGSYITNIGAQRFEFIGKGWTRGRGDLESVKWFLEEIELPSEEEVYEESVKCYGNTPGIRSLNIFKHGANFILNHIKK